MLCSGRLNVLANVVRKPMAQIFAEFSGKKLKGPEGWVEWGAYLVFTFHVLCCVALITRAVVL